MGHRGANVINPLIANQVMRVPDGIEDFAYCNRRGGMFPNHLETFLQLRGCWVFHPEEVKRLQLLAKPSCLNWCQSMMAVVKQVQFLAKRLTHARKQRRHLTKIRLRCPLIL